MERYHNIIHTIIYYNITYIKIKYSTILCPLKINLLTKIFPVKILVRGRAFDETKPETFNQLWTFEEQKRLEELLVEYPPEDVEMRRWTKIARALGKLKISSLTSAILKQFLVLGNRTPKQVSSRVQKYFIKLLRAGLPIPGRGPKVKIDFRKGLTHKQRNNNFLMKRSTFFPHQDISFDISDENKKHSGAEENVSTEEYLSTLYMYHSFMRHTKVMFINIIMFRKKIQ